MERRSEFMKIKVAYVLIQTVNVPNIRNQYLYRRNQTRHILRLQLSFYLQRDLNLRHARCWKYIQNKLLKLMMSCGLAVPCGPHLWALCKGHALYHCRIYVHQRKRPIWSVYSADHLKVRGDSAAPSNLISPLIQNRVELIRTFTWRSFCCLRAGGLVNQSAHLPRKLGTKATAYIPLSNIVILLLWFLYSLPLLLIYSIFSLFSFHSNPIISYPLKRSFIPLQVKKADHSGRAV
jgi:hypothetical protein